MIFHGLSGRVVVVSLRMVLHILKSVEGGEGASQRS